MGAGALQDANRHTTLVIAGSIAGCLHLLAQQARGRASRRRVAASKAGCATGPYGGSLKADNPHMNFGSAVAHNQRARSRAMRIASVGRKLGCSALGGQWLNAHAFQVR